MTYEVHPVADLFPMLADDELAELAEDIKQRGLLQPIVRDPDGRILDGRNRLAACELAGVEPRFETYGGKEPALTALAGNGQVRELTKRQKAIVGAMAIMDSNLEVPDQRSVAAALRIHASSLSEALVIVKYARELAEAILAGGQSFSQALGVAQARQAAAIEIQSKKMRLNEDANDLLGLVDEGRMSLDDAIAVLNAREEKARQEAEAARREAEARASKEEQERRQREQERQESLERDRDRIRSVITGWPTMRNTIIPDPDGELATDIITGLGQSDQEALRKILAEVTP